MRLITYILLFLMATVFLVAAQDTTLHELWASSDYSVKTFPDAWRPEKLPPTVREVDIFKKFDLKSAGVSIINFIAHYGIPDRYLVTQKSKGHNFLIYDFPSGHSVCLYVHEPPYDTFAAIVIIDSVGNIVRLIK